MSFRNNGGVLEEDLRCPICKIINKRKNSNKCDECGLWFHLSCVRLTGAQAQALRRWLCPACLHPEAALQTVSDNTVSNSDSILFSDINKHHYKL